MDTDKKKSKSLKGIIPIAISVVALCASMFSLYESYLRPGQIDIAVSENIELFYRAGVGNLGIILSATFSNEGATSATVDKVALLIQRPEDQGCYILEPIYYMDLAAKGDLIFKSRLAPLTVLSHSFETKHIFFQSSLEHPDESPLIGSGIYDLKLLAWYNGSLQLKIADSLSVFLSEQNLAALEKGRKEGTMRTEVVEQFKWQSWQPRRLTESELNELLKITKKY